MDWTFAIERWRVPLIGEVVKLFAEIGLTEGGTVERVPKPVYRYVLGILRTAESAVRRLIVAAARNIMVEPKPKRPAPTKPKTTSKDKGQSKQEGKAKRKRRPVFKLFDPPKRFKKFFGRLPKRRRAEPRIRTFDAPDPRYPIFRLLGLHPPTTPVPPPVPDVEERVDDGMVNAAPLIRRLLAITDALQDIPRQAMRLALWQARPKEERLPERWSPLRPGRPPGFRQRNIHEVDEILKECHWLALSGHPPLDDTS